MEPLLLIEKKHFDELNFKIDTLFKKATEKKDEDKWMTMEAVVSYLGFSRTWVMYRKNKIGCFSDGKGLRFKKSNVDRYMEANSFKIK